MPGSEYGNRRLLDLRRLNLLPFLQVWLPESLDIYLAVVEMAKTSDLSVLVKEVATYLHLSHDFHLLEVSETFFAGSDSFQRNAVFLAIELVRLIRALYSTKSHTSLTLTLEKVRVSSLCMSMTPEFNVYPLNQHISTISTSKIHNQALRRKP